MPQADCLDGSRGALAGSGLAAPASILAAMFVLSDGLRATRFQIGLEPTVADVERAGRMKVNADLTLPGHPEVFVVGDLMSLDGLPGVAQVAIQSGRHAAATIKRRRAGDAGSQPFRYRDRGSLATISRFRAVGSIGRLRVAGFAAWLLWLLVHLVWLTGFKNRVLVLAHWTTAFLSHGRTERAITEQQVFGRQALAASVPGGEDVD